MEQNLQQRSAEIFVLMYHRISVADTDPWGICVSPKNFEAQIKFLKNHYNIISVDAAIKQLTTKHINDTSICITFDDGYADNYTHAKPVLEKYNCPATFFIPTAFVDEPKLFWWDELELLLLHSKKLPRQLELKIAGKTNQYSFNENFLSREDWIAHTKWKWYEPFPTHRCFVFMDIWQQLWPLPYNEIETQIAYIKKWAGAVKNNDERLPMSEKQLQSLQANKLFTIALHTHTHIDLGLTIQHSQAEDISTNKEVLSDKFGNDSRLLAYPYGRYNNHTLDTVSAMQLAACFTTEAGSINNNSNPLTLGRFQVMDWDVESFKNHLNSWQASG